MTETTIPEDQRDPRRRFYRTEVTRRWRAQGRVCPGCQRQLDSDLFDGDHVIPHSAGGPTTYENLMALCRTCNGRKGAQTYEAFIKIFERELLTPGDGNLRRWQRRALERTLKHILKSPVLIEACPGAGKTRFGLEVAHNLLEAGEISRVLIVVHTRGIADGWLLSASGSDPGAPTLPLVGTRGWRPYNAIPNGVAGAVVSYQSLANMSDTFLAHATDITIERQGRKRTTFQHNTLVIFDEVHHVATDKTWGQTAQVAFAAGAKCILSMSGTPFRTDEQAIAFVPHEGGSAKPLYRYGYGQALRDKACRPVEFITTKGATTFRNEDDTEHTVTFDDKLTKTGRSRRLKTALDYVADDAISDQLLRSANDYLNHLRTTGDPDAAGLVVCFDCDHADRIARHMKDRIISRRPVVACSRTNDPEDLEAADALRQFKAPRATKPWLVAVNMVSEGIDIRRLRVVVYLTNRTTKLAFRQIVGRVMRTDPNDPGNKGRIYMPADPAMIAMAQEVTKQVTLLPPVTLIEEEPGIPVVKIRDDDPKPWVRFQPLGSVGEQGDAYDTGKRHATGDLIERTRLFITDQGLTANAESLALAAMGNRALLNRILAYRTQYEEAS